MAPLPPPPPSLLARGPADGAAAATPAPLAPASIALIIVGCLALIAACIGGAICYRWYQRRRRSQQHQHQQLPLAAPNEKAVTPIGAQKAPFSSTSLAAALKHLEYDDQPASGAAFMHPLPISRTLGPLASAFSNASLNQFMPRQQQQQDDEEAQKQRPPLPRQSIRYDPHTSFATNCLRGLTQALDLPLDLHDPSTTAPTAPPLPIPAAAAVAPPALSSSSSTSASASAFLTAGESTPAALSSMHSESSLGTGSASERRPSTTTMMSSGGETAATSVMAHEEDPMPPTGKQMIATALQTQQRDKVKGQEAATSTPAASSTPFMSGYHHAIFPEPQSDADPQDESHSGDGSGDLSSLSISHSHSHSHSGSISLSVRTRRQQRRRERTHANRGPSYSYVRARDRNASSVSSRSPAHHPFTMSSPWLAAGDSTSFIQEQWRINTADESDPATRAIEAGMAFLPSLDGPGPLVEAGGSPVGGSGAAEFALVSAEEGKGVGMERRPSGLGITTLDAEGDDDAISDDGSQPSDGDDDDDASQSRDVPQRRTRRSRRQRTTTSPGSIMQNAKWASSSTPKLPTGTPRDYFTGADQQQQQQQQQQRHLEAEQRSFLPTVSPLSPTEDGQPWSPPPSFLAVQPTSGPTPTPATSRPHSTTSDLQSPLQRLLLGSPWDEHLARFPGPPPLAVTEAAAAKTLEERRGEVGRWRREVLPGVEGELNHAATVEQERDIASPPQSMSTSPSFRLRPLSLCAVSSLGLPPALATATVPAPLTSAATGSGVPYTVTTIRKNGSGDTPTLASVAAATATANAKKAKRGSFLYHISSPPQHLMQQHHQQQRGVGVAV